ncbi:hypothetical protein [Streptomyces triticirhizae]|uniref:Uncharacterized protein n=1 Tax=Streptomyces triticirhizae TaxID=2483353 RepID=A0A3M2LPS3_9ACTN|nr:hypothetical protein [Streptomyces triticirhizae]RMI36848.1 hypothetical protein EBN88_20455 [Streptomyces triticirhizae]
MKDHQIIALFEGSPPEVEVVIRTRATNLLAIAHEFGYVISAHRIYPQTGILRFVFARDDSEMARRRAAWAHYHYRINGAWWATSNPGPSLTAISPMQAGEARYGLYLQEQRPHSWYQWRAAGVAGAAAVLGIVQLFSSPLGAIICLAIALFFVSFMIWGPRWRARKEAEYRRTLEDFERQRVFWSYDQQGGGG